MKRTLVVLSLATFFLYGCPPGIVKRGPAPAPRPGHVPPGQMKKVAPAPVAVVPVLPPLVVFEDEPYYYYEGFYYFYDNGGWYYSKTKRGKRIKLPKSHYPKDVKYKLKGKPKIKGNNKRKHGNWD